MSISKSGSDQKYGNRSRRFWILSGAHHGQWFERQSDADGFSHGNDDCALDAGICNKAKGSEVLRDRSGYNGNDYTPASLHQVFQKLKSLIW